MPPRRRAPPSRTWSATRATAGVARRAPPGGGASSLRRRRRRSPPGGRAPRSGRRAARPRPRPARPGPAPPALPCGHRPRAWAQPWVPIRRDRRHAPQSRLTPVRLGVPSPGRSLPLRGEHLACRDGQVVLAARASAPHGQRFGGPARDQTLVLEPGQRRVDGADRVLAAPRPPHLLSLIHISEPTRPY